ncbi:hypothetical protein G5I_00660 [Acromyrmex echinatior]|uniref:Uncharacterized protein n=1 Tax=Acromyrmex echinatior TaxID=103372 RepID=F4W5G3_ACREC|nr:hypothetical protein G5I_00660 [Acromyrmex echinatior]
MSVAVRLRFLRCPLVFFYYDPPYNTGLKTIARVSSILEVEEWSTKGCSMKFRERYANQTASIRRLGVAAATLSRSANLFGAGLGWTTSLLRDPPTVLAADSKEAKAARNLQVQRKHDVHERAAEEWREKKRRRDPLKIEMRMKKRNGTVEFSGEEKGTTYVTTRRALDREGIGNSDRNSGWQDAVVIAATSHRKFEKLFYVPSIRNHADAFEATAWDTNRRCHDASNAILQLLQEESTVSELRGSSLDVPHLSFLLLSSSRASQTVAHRLFFAYKSKKGEESSAGSLQSERTERRYLKHMQRVQLRSGSPLLVGEEKQKDPGNGGSRSAARNPTHDDLCDLGDDDGPPSPPPPPFLPPFTSFSCSLRFLRLVRVFPTNTREARILSTRMPGPEKYEILDSRV